MFTESIFILKCGKATLYPVLCIQGILSSDGKCVYLKVCMWKAVNSVIPAGVIIIIIMITIVINLIFLIRKRSKHLHDEMYFPGSSDSYHNCLNQWEHSITRMYLYMIACVYCLTEVADTVIGLIFIIVYCIPQFPQHIIGKVVYFFSCKVFK
jgi:hypothetical protein